MLSKSKLKKLGTQLTSMSVSQEEQAKAAGITRVTLKKVFAGKTYKREIIEKLIALRNQKLIEATELETAI